MNDTIFSHYTVVACQINGVVYLEGDHVPNDDPCKNWWVPCSDKMSHYLDWATESPLYALLRGFTVPIATCASHGEEVLLLALKPTPANRLPDESKHRFCCFNMKNFFLDMYDMHDQYLTFLQCM